MKSGLKWDQELDGPVNPIQSRQELLLKHSASKQSQRLKAVEYKFKYQSSNFTTKQTKFLIEWTKTGKKTLSVMRRKKESTLRYRSQD